METKDFSRFPWAEFMSPEDFVSEDHSYDSASQLGKFTAHIAASTSVRAGGIRYYFYDPTEHGFPADKKYPLMMALHGMNGGFQGPRAVDWAGAAMYASEKYQEAVGGMYIFCPLANEKNGRCGRTEDSWTTTKTESDTSLYSEEQLLHIWNSPLEWKRNAMRFLGADSIYSGSLHRLLHRILDENEGIDREHVFLFGTSAGGFMAWRMLINHPEDFKLGVVMSAAYIPGEKELQGIVDAGTKVFVCHGHHDEVLPFDLIIGANYRYYETLPGFTTYYPELVRCGNHGVTSVPGDNGFEMGQHCINNAIQQNLIFDDGTPYDERFPEGVTGIMKELLG